VKGPQVISIEEAARHLGITDELAYQLAEAGQFPGDAATKLGRRWRVSVPKLLRVTHGYPVTTKLQA
jgi:excisionase family DNA binding protein